MRFRIPEHLRKQKLVHGPLHHQPEGNEDTDEDLTARQQLIAKKFQRDWYARWCLTSMDDATVFGMVALRLILIVISLSLLN